MIINKYLSILITVCFFSMLVLLVSLSLRVMLPGFNMSYGNVILVIVLFVVSRSFYNYLRNDEKFTNNRNRSSDMKGEFYITKGENDIKKVFIVVWVILILLILAVTSLFLVG